MIYRLTLKNDKPRQYARLGLVVGLIHIVIFIFLLFNANNRYAFVTASAILFTLVVFYLQKKKSPPVSAIRNPFNLMYLLYLVCWILFGYFWLAPVLLLLGILNALAAVPPVVILNDALVQWPSLPAKKIAWSSLNNVVVKDNVLTIDFKNDQLLQQELDPAENLDENAFNKWAQNFLEA